MSKVRASTVGDVRLFFSGSRSWNTKEGWGAFVSAGQLIHIDSGEAVPDGEMSVYGPIDGNPPLEVFLIAWPLITQNFPRTDKTWNMTDRGVPARTDNVIFFRA